MQVNQVIKENSIRELYDTFIKGNEVKMNDRLLSYKDLSSRWQIPVNTLRIWVMKGHLKVVKLGRHVRFPLAYILAIEEAGGLI
jgi:excisionase family DNA binding protein